MVRPPFAARVMTGLVVTALEETRKLPTTAVTLPMTALSTAVQVVMRVQQNIAELAIKGDDTLDQLFHRAEEQPSWATFDEDLPAAGGDDADAPPSVDRDDLPGDPATLVATTTPIDDVDAAEISSAAGRFALYSSAPETVPDPPAGEVTAASGDDVPAIVESLGYDGLTLAQLRAKLRTIALEDLRTLAEYERSHRGRAPFATMLDNRIAAAGSR